MIPDSRNGWLKPALKMQLKVESNRSKGNPVFLNRVIFNFFRETALFFIVSYFPACHAEATSEGESRRSTFLSPRAGPARRDSGSWNCFAQNQFAMTAFKAGCLFPSPGDVVPGRSQKHSLQNYSFMLYLCLRVGFNSGSGSQNPADSGWNRALEL